MKMRWLIGGIAVLALAATGGAWQAGILKIPAGMPGGGDKPKKPDVAFAFVADELVRPVLATMPEVIEFSGPLVAPSTAVVRAKAKGQSDRAAGR